jgi:hypothetical protein
MWPLVAAITSSRVAVVVSGSLVSSAISSAM